MQQIDEIIALEWAMFQKVNEGGPRASCQDDPVTFDGMRRAQFDAWSPEAVDSYRRDLLAAQAAGRNLVMEKYIRMMERTDPDGSAALLERLPAPTQRQQDLAGTINETLLAQTETLFAQFPHVADTGRPLHSSGDSRWDTSVETYQLSELLTYSEATLEALHRHILALEGAGVSLARRILENSARHYGYESLERAEERAAAWSAEQADRCGCGER